MGDHEKNTLIDTAAKQPTTTFEYSINTSNKSDEKIIAYYNKYFKKVYANNTLKFTLEVPTNIYTLIENMLNTYVEFYVACVLSDVFNKINYRFNVYMKKKGHRNQPPKARGRVFRKAAREYRHYEAKVKGKPFAETNNNKYDTKVKKPLHDNFKLLKTELRHLKVILKDLVKYVSNPTVSEAFATNTNKSFNLSIITYSLYKYIRNYHNKDTKNIKYLKMYNYDNLGYDMYKTMYSDTLLKSQHMSQLSQLPNTQVFIGTFKDSNILVKYKSSSSQLNSLLDVQAKPITKFKYIIQLSLKDHETGSVLEAMIFDSNSLQQLSGETQAGGDKKSALNNFKQNVVQKVLNDDNNEDIVERIVQYDISKNDTDKQSHLSAIETNINNIMSTTNTIIYNKLKSDTQKETYNKFIIRVLDKVRQSSDYKIIHKIVQRNPSYFNNESEYSSINEDEPQEPEQAPQETAFVNILQKYPNTPRLTNNNIYISIDLIEAGTKIFYPKVQSWIREIIGKPSTPVNIVIKLKYFVDIKLEDIVIAYCSLYYNKKIHEIINELNAIRDANVNIVIPTEGKMKRTAKLKLKKLAKILTKKKHNHLNTQSTQHKDYEAFKNAYKTQLRLLKRELDSLKRIINDLLKYVTDNEKVIDIIEKFTKNNIKIIPVSYALSRGLGNTFTPYDNTFSLMPNIGTIHQRLYKNKTHIAETHKTKIFINNDNDNNLLIFDKNSKQQDTFITFDKDYKYKYALQIVIGKSDILTDLHTMFHARSEQSEQSRRSSLTRSSSQRISQSKGTQRLSLHNHSSRRSQRSATKATANANPSAPLAGSQPEEEVITEPRPAAEEEGVEEGAPPPPPPAAAPPTTAADRGNFLAQIQKGKTLRKVTEAAPQQERRTSANRGNLLEEIQKGKTLRKVNKTERGSQIERVTNTQGFPGVLRKAIATRRTATHGESGNENDSNITTNNEWNENENNTSGGGSRKHNSRSTKRKATKKRIMYKK